MNGNGKIEERVEHEEAVVPEVVDVPRRVVEEPQTGVESRASVEPRAERERVEDFNQRDLIFFKSAKIAPNERKHIVVEPAGDERVMLGRIFLHKTCAENLIPERIMIGETVIAKGSGTAEIFLATIPNWTPQGKFFDKKNPLIMIVHNVRHFEINIAGSVVVYRRS